jgi:hypothetical protein
MGDSSLMTWAIFSKDGLYFHLGGESPVHFLGFICKLWDETIAQVCLTMGHICPQDGGINRENDE